MVSTPRRFPVLVSAVLLLLAGPSAFAQDYRDSRQPSLADAVKAVASDPTTYIPAVVSYTATRLDWNSSQVFFRHGMYEHNARFTVSGRPDDVAISYGAGNRQMLIDTLRNLPLSIANNFSAMLIERALIERNPDHQKLLRAFIWIERISFASSLSYALSANHFRQWQENERRARQLGY